jgi:hypothetical protein
MRPNTLRFARAVPLFRHGAHNTASLCACPLPIKLPVSPTETKKEKELRTVACAVPVE